MFDSIIRIPRVLDSGAGTLQSQPAPALDADAVAWANAVVVNGGTVSPSRLALVSSLINGVKSDGVWSKLDRFYLFATENQPSSLTDLVARSLATSLGSSTFNADGGWSGIQNSGSDAIDTGFNATIGSNQFTANSCHISAWDNNNLIAGSYVALGIQAGSNVNITDIYPNFIGDTKSYFRINDASSSAGVTSGNGQGYWVASRTDASTSTGYKNGSVIANPNAAAGTLQNGNFYLLAENNLGVGHGTGGNQNEFSAMTIGGGLTATDVTNLYNRLTTYLLAVAGVTQIETYYWIASVMRKGGTVSAPRRRLVDNFISGLKSDGVWTKLDRLWLLAAENEASALADLVQGATTAFNSGPASFTQDDGYTGIDGSFSVMVDTGFNPTTAFGPNYTQNSAHMSVWIDTYTAPVSGVTTMGVFDGTVDCEIDIVDSGSGNVFGLINESSAGAVGFTPPGTKTGHWLVNRSGASASQIYQNGSLFQSPNTTSNGAPNTTVGILARRVTGGTGIANGSPNQTAMASIGGSLTGTDATNLYNRLRTYMTAIGVP